MITRGHHLSPKYRTPDMWSQRRGEMRRKRLLDAAAGSPAPCFLAHMMILPGHQCWPRIFLSRVDVEQIHIFFCAVQRTATGRMVAAAQRTPRRLMSFDYYPTTGKPPQLSTQSGRRSTRSRKLVWRDGQAAKAQGGPTLSAVDFSR